MTDSKSHPKVSVIVPNYNHARFLRERLDSIYNQTFQDFEVILLDDASTDGSVEILREYASRPRTRLILNEQNSGGTFAQWRKGIALANGEYVWIAESDDYCKHTFLESLTRRLDDHPEALICSCNILFVDECNRYARKRTRYPPGILNSHILLPDLFISGNYLPNASAAVIRREAFSYVDWADVVRKRYCGDWLMYVMMLLNGSLVTHAEYLSFFRQHSNTVSMSTHANHLFFSEGLHIAAYIRQYRDMACIKRLDCAIRWYCRLRRSCFDRSKTRIMTREIRHVFGIQKLMFFCSYYMFSMMRRYHSARCLYREVTMRGCKHNRQTYQAESE